MRIGIFDSGVGGLTVAREIKKRYPNHSLIYIGDTARVPWGVRSPKIIKQFSLQLLRFLEKKKVSFIVVACHAASSVAIPFLKKKTKIPIYDVIKPAVDSLANKNFKRIGVLGTPATIKSKSWEKAIKAKRPGAKIFPKAAPLLVPIVEEGLENHPVAKQMVRYYLADLLSRKIDMLVLACTHYPLLLKTIKSSVGSKVKLINPGEEIGKRLGTRNSETLARDEFYFTDLTERVRQNLSHFYGRKISGQIKEVSVEDL